MLKNRKYLPYLLLLGVHVVIAMIAFLHFRLNPHGVLFSDIGDGLKNIFTLTTYVKAPITSEGLLKYNTFQYPFGDYVYYTDNTPLFSIPFRWYCHHVSDISAHTIPVLYTIVILNIILCGLLLYYILRNVAGDNPVSFIIAAILPWANMQILRIWAGHYAFSFSSFVLIAICLVMMWHKYRGQTGKQILVALGMCLLSFFGFLAQGYYLAILTVFCSAMLFFYGVYHRKDKQGIFSIGTSLVVAAASLGSALGLLALTDPYLAMRPEHATGYDWMEHKVRFSALFTHYNFQRVYFPVSSGYITNEAEVSGYLGNIGLYAFLVFGVLMIVSRSFRELIVTQQKKFFSSGMRSALVFGGLVLLSISFGEHYYTAEPHKNGMHFLNVLNPFFYIHYLTKRVEQFRALERFVWPFFFVFNIWMAYNLSVVYDRYNAKIKGLIVIWMLLLGGYELRDYIWEMQAQTGHKNIFSDESLQGVVPPHVDVKKYQAILPVPYYSLGAEDYDLSMNDDERWSNFTYRLSYRSGLPLMASKMSRTPREYSYMLMKLVAYDSLDNRLRAKLNEKPVLVIVSKRLLTDKTGENIPRDNTAAKMYDASLNFAVRNHLSAIDSVDDVLFYEWYLPKM